MPPGDEKGVAEGRYPSTAIRTPGPITDTKIDKVIHGLGLIAIGIDRILRSCWSGQRQAGFPLAAFEQLDVLPLDEPPPRQCIRDPARI